MNVVWQLLVAGRPRQWTKNLVILDILFIAAAFVILAVTGVWANGLVSLEGNLL